MSGSSSLSILKVTLPFVLPFASMAQTSNDGLMAHDVKTWKCSTLHESLHSLSVEEKEELEQKREPGLEMKTPLGRRCVWTTLLCSGFRRIFPSRDLLDKILLCPFNLSLISLSFLFNVYGVYSLKKDGS